MAKILVTEGRPKAKIKIQSKKRDDQREIRTIDTELGLCNKENRRGGFCCWRNNKVQDSVLGVTEQELLIAAWLVHPTDTAAVILVKYVAFHY